MTQTFKEKLAELEEKRASNLTGNEKNIHDDELDTSDISESERIHETFDKPVKNIKRKSSSKINSQKLAIFVSLFVIVLAYLYATDVINFSVQSSQTSLDKSFVYKGGIDNGQFTGNAVVTDKSGNTLTTKFKSGKIDGDVKYQKKDGYSVTQTKDKNTTVELKDHTVVKRNADQYVTTTPNFSYTGAWRFAGNWQGNMTFSNKASYQGTWEKGLPSGQGVYTTTLGETITSKFKSGVPQNEN